MDWFNQEQWGVINALLQASRSSAFLFHVLPSACWDAPGSCKGAQCGTGLTVTLMAGFSKWAPKTPAFRSFAGVNKAAASLPHCSLHMPCFELALSVLAPVLLSRGLTCFSSTANQSLTTVLAVWHVYMAYALRELWRTCFYSVSECMIFV